MKSSDYVRNSHGIHWKLLDLDLIITIILE